MQRLLLKILLYFFLSNYALLGALDSNAQADLGQTKALLETRELIELGKYEKADAIIIVQLKEKPRDAQWRYLEALLRAEMGLSLKNKDILDRAVFLFERLSEEFPELPEPYNNLAVLYNKMGREQKAIKSFELAILNNPGYTLAYENLADLYLFLARETYLKGIKKSRKNNDRLEAKSNFLKNVPFFSFKSLDLDTLKKEGVTK
ncbi:MAG: hypothetical protein CMK52_06195 [Proteobacteria bacterium]|nr:hypothetical protein [Pseudomonadota bacterium]|tara:strand:- start:470 stop:1084 length:615 start_codon:yes stop_codon:yes gene_type:complete